jgi:serine/threonine protein kinase, bacterial
VALDAQGNVYVADTGNNEIRKITPTGVVTTLAGSTTPGSADGAGSAASFRGPYGVALDAQGNIYAADAGNNEIRKITPTGMVTTFAGSTAIGYSNGTGAAARFFFPIGVTVDSAGDVYVADEANYAIRKITPSGVVSTLAGSTNPGSADGPALTASFFNPTQVAVDGPGNVYVADTGNNEIRKVTAAGTVTTIVGGTSRLQLIPGPLPGSLGRPYGIALSVPDKEGNWNMVISVGNSPPSNQFSTTSAIAEIVFANAAFN